MLCRSLIPRLVPTLQSCSTSEQVSEQTGLSETLSEESFDRHLEFSEADEMETEHHIEEPAAQPPDEI